MGNKIQQGYLLLADISGFDAYITKVELGHAKGIMKELLELILEGLSPPLSLASLEGDAILAFAAEEDIPTGSCFIEILEATYAEFRDRLLSIQRNNTCNCRACADAPTLDLKFIVHYGKYSLQSVDGERLELGGLDAKLVRDRQLKDQVGKLQNSGAYVLFTEASLDHMGISIRGMVENSSSYPHLGNLKTRRLDLHSSYEKLRQSRRTSIPEEQATFSMSFDFPVPPSTLWMWLNNPEKRTNWMIWRTWREVRRPWGRIGVGAVNHCAHGFGTLVETILAWSPYQSYTVHSRQDSIKFSMVQTFHLDPSSDAESTHLTIHTKVENAGPFGLPRILLRKSLEVLWKLDYQLLRKMIVEERLLTDQSKRIPWRG